MVVGCRKIESDGEAGEAGIGHCSAAEPARLDAMKPTRQIRVGGLEVENPCKIPGKKIRIKNTKTQERHRTTLKATRKKDPEHQDGQAQVPCFVACEAQFESLPDK